MKLLRAIDVINQMKAMNKKKDRKNKMQKCVNAVMIASTSIKKLSFKIQHRTLYVLCLSFLNRFLTNI